MDSDYDFHCSGFSLDYKDDSVESLLTLREKLNDPDPSVLYKTCSELTKVRIYTFYHAATIIH